VIRSFFIAAGLAVVSTPAFAHPHIFIDARMIVAFNDAGEVMSITHAWLFDAAFSAWETQGRDSDGDGVVSEAELSAYAAETVARLGPLRFYTKAGEGVANLPLASMDDARMTLEDGRLLLVFGLEPQTPYRIKDSLEIAVYDPEYYTAFNLTGSSAVILADAPEGCVGAYQPPRPLPPELEAQLYSLPPGLTTLPPELAAALRGREGAVIVSCGAQP
jgi:nickel/cobalt exporter